MFSDVKVKINSFEIQQSELQGLTLLARGSTLDFRF